MQDYGFTVHAYWEKRRVRRAHQALEVAGKRVKEVASELGFVQVSHFSAWFKRHAGLSPRAYPQSLEIPENTNYCLRRARREFTMQKRK